jgi:hypothetical protein
MKYHSKFLYVATADNMLYKLTTKLVNGAFTYAIADQTQGHQTDITSIQMTDDQIIDN